MAGERKLTVVLAGDHRGLDSSLSHVGKSTDGLGGKFAKFGKIAAAGLAAAGVGAIALGKSFVDAAVESQKVTKQTEAVLKSMGNQAGLTADDVAKLSTKLSMQSGVDDELIQSASNVLLTFGKVRDEVGKGNDVFTRAQQSALDMSVALGSDLQGSTIMLGKALNDPIKGITAMTRAGVSFTQQQKDQIKAMVESGDTLGAQKLILAEMENQFGGSAAAQATAGDRLNVVWGNLQEQLGAKLLPVVEKAATWLADHLPGAMDKVSAASQRVVAFVQLHWPAIRDAIVGAVEAIRPIVEGVVTFVTTLWQNFGDNILRFVQAVWPHIQQVISGALEIIRGVVQTITALIQGDWSAVWEGIKAILAGAWSAIQGIIGAALEAIKGIIGLALEIVSGIFSGAWDGIVSFTASIPSRLVGALQSLAGLLGNLATAAMRSFLNAHMTIAQEVLGFLRGLPGRMVQALGDLAGIFYRMGADMIRGMLNGVKSMAGALLDAAKSVITAPISWAKSFLGIGSPSKLFNKFGGWTMQGYIDGITSKTGPLQAKLQSVMNMVSSAGSDMAAFMKTLSTGFTENEGTPIEMLAIKLRSAMGLLSGQALRTAGAGTNGTATTQELPLAIAADGWARPGGLMPQSVHTTVVLDGEIVGQAVSRWQDQRGARNGS